MSQKMKLCQIQQYRKNGWQVCELSREDSAQELKKSLLFFVSQLCNSVDCNQFKDYSNFTSPSVFWLHGADVFHRDFSS